MSLRPGRRAACPSLAYPMQTGDGWLVRLAPLARALDGSDMVHLAQLAMRHGNGELEITQRGNLQARGFTPASAALFHAAIKQRLPQPVTGPVVTLEPGSEETVAGKVRAHLLEFLADLALTFPPKCSVIIEEHGHWGVSDLAADVRLRVNAHECALGIGGSEASATWYCPVAATGENLSQRLVEAATLVLEQLASAKGQRGDTLKHQHVVARCLATAGWRPVSSDALGEGETPGVGHLSGHCLVLAAAFGALSADVLERLGQACWQRKVVSWWLPGRKLLLLGCTTALASLHQLAGRLGLITDADDVRLRMSVCQGAPGCASGWLATRPLANDLADHLEKHPEKFPAGHPGKGVGQGAVKAPLLHVAGCAKGCAAPNTATRCLVGVGEQRLAVIRHGLAHDLPDACVDMPDTKDVWQLIDVVEQH